MIGSSATIPHLVPAVIDVDERQFEQEVLQRSHEVPVVVDFWAPWCGPCRTLGPTLEKLANEAKGAFVLAKVNVDNNQQLAMRFQVQGIPAVKAFRDGKLVDEFTGALPESRIRTWLKQVVPSQADNQASQAAALEQRDPQMAERMYRQILANDPSNATARFGLGRLLLFRGANAYEQFQAIPGDSPLYQRAQSLLELDQLLMVEAADVAALSSTIASSPANLEARWQLAAALLRQQAYQATLDQLLEIVSYSRAFREDGARKAILAMFALLGDDHPLVPEYRRSLTNALF